MKIDQSICNDWTLSPLKNCLKACGLKIKIASEPSVSAAFVRRCFLYVFTLLLPCLCVSTGVFFFASRAHMRVFVVHGHCLYPGAVLPVRSQVFISLDSGRLITSPQAAAHPSYQGLPKDSLQHALLIATLLQTAFSAGFHWFTLARCGCACVSGKRVWVWWCLQGCLYFQRYNYVLFKFMLSPHAFFEWHCPLRTVLTFPVVHCLPPQVGFACVCLHICVHLSLCLSLGCARYSGVKNSPSGISVGTRFAVQ